MVETDQVVVEAGDVPGEILAQAKEYNCDLVAMSTHGSPVWAEDCWVASQTP